MGGTGCCSTAACCAGPTAFFKSPPDGDLCPAGWRAPPSSRLLVVRSDGMVVRSDPIDPGILSRVVATAASLQPELDAMVADYRNRCRFVPSPGVVY